MIAMALACDPQLVIADEPTTALDVMIQAQILRLIEQLVAEQDVGLIMISHDLAVLADTAQASKEVLTAEERRVLSREILRRRRRLQRRADDLGQILYAERPRKLASRLEKRARKALAKA
jgi:ABC-type glutathione transport system ATPase component